MSPAKSRNRFTNARLLCSAAFALLILIASFTAAQGEPSPGRTDGSEGILAEAGLIDVRPDASEPGTQFIPLQGEWEFYWNELLDPETLRQRGSEPAYADVPSSWRAQPAAVFGGQPDIRHGYGTYRLRLNLPPDDIGGSKALYIQSVGNAYRLWTDGRERPGLGVVGMTRSEETPRNYANLIFIEPRQETMELVIQVSNHSFREGGIISEIVYGDAAVLNSYLLKKMFFDIFVIGGLALVGLFHLTVYGFRQKNRLTLLVGLVTLAMSVRTLVLNGYLSKLVLGVDHWELLTKIEYVTENIGFLFLVLLMQYMYPKESNRHVLLASCAIALTLSLFVMLTPARVFTETMLAQTVVKAAIFAYFVFYVGIVAYIRKREGALINLLAVLFLVVAIVNDMLYYARLIETIELFSFSSVLFLLAQAIIVSYRYVRIDRRNDALVVELGEMNASLEQRVQLRTQKLHEANEQLSEMKEIRTKMLVNIAHDLTSPLTGVQSYLYLINRGALTADRPDIVRQLMEKTGYIQRLIRDLFELAMLESGEQSFDFARVHAGQWLDDVYRQFAGDLRREQFELQRGRWETAAAGADIHVHIDRYRMMQVFQNYIDNAVKFSRGRSSVITVQVFPGERREDETYDLIVEIIDRGEGISPERLPHVFERFYRKQTNNDEGNGLGLAIVAEIVGQHRGTAGVRSEPGEGSTFYFTLPAAG